MSEGHASLPARIVGHLVFWSPAIFISVAIVASIAVDLYGRPPAKGRAAAEHAWCLRAALSLSDELRGRATLSLGPAVKSTVRESWRTFEPDFDARLESAAARCRDTDELRTLFDQLREVFQGYREIVSGNHEILDGPQSALDRALQALGGPRAPRNR